MKIHNAITFADFKKNVNKEFIYLGSEAYEQQYKLRNSPRLSQLAIEKKKLMIERMLKPNEASKILRNYFKSLNLEDITFKFSRSKLEKRHEYVDKYIIDPDTDILETAIREIKYLAMNLIGYGFTFPQNYIYKVTATKADEEIEFITRVDIYDKTIFRDCDKRYEEANKQDFEKAFQYLEQRGFTLAFSDIQKSYPLYESFKKNPKVNMLLGIEHETGICSVIVNFDDRESAKTALDDFLKDENIQSNSFLQNLQGEEIQLSQTKGQMPFFRTQKQRELLYAYLKVSAGQGAADWTKAYLEAMEGETLEVECDGFF